MGKGWRTVSVGLLFSALNVAWAQETPVQPTTVTPSEESAQQASPQETPQSGQQQTQQTPTAPITENPPLSGLDLPSLEPHAAPISFLQAAATVDESVTSNASNVLGGGTVSSITRGLGSLTLRRLWSHYDLGLDYVGGVGYYDTGGEGLKSLQQMDFEQKMTWKRGEASVRDSFSYLPEGNFGASNGAIGSEGIEALGTSAFASFWGGSALGSLGLTPRILNMTLAEGQQYMSPKSAVTAAGGYAFTHFFGSGATTLSFIDGSQVSAQGGYDRVLTPHTQVAVVFGYQGFDFSVFGTSFHSDVIEGMYGHRISGRLDFLAGAGPQFTFINTLSAVCSDASVPILLCTLTGNTLNNEIVKNTTVGVAGQARLRYRMARSELSLIFERFETSGSGFFAGAETNVIRAAADRQLSRVWSGTLDLGYAQNTRIQPLTSAQVLACTSATQTSQSACPANDASNYNYGFVGVAFHRPFGRTVHAFIGYQFTELAFGSSYCVGNAPCSRISNRQSVTLGLDWLPRPIRID